MKTDGPGGRRLRWELRGACRWGPGSLRPHTHLDPCSGESLGWRLDCSACVPSTTPEALSLWDKLGESEERDPSTACALSQIHCRPRGSQREGSSSDSVLLREASRTRRLEEESQDLLLRVWEGRNSEELHALEKPPILASHPPVAAERRGREGFPGGGLSAEVGWLGAATSKHRSEASL